METCRHRRKQINHRKNNHLGYRAWLRWRQWIQPPTTPRQKLTRHLTIDWRSKQRREARLHQRCHRRDNRLEVQCVSKFDAVKVVDVLRKQRRPRNRQIQHQRLPICGHRCNPDCVHREILEMLAVGATRPLRRSHEENACQRHLTNAETRALQDACALSPQLHAEKTWAASATARRGASDGTIRHAPYTSRRRCTTSY